MLGQRQRKTFLNISGGKVVHRTDQGRTETFDFVEGTLEKIYKRDRDFRGEKVPYWYLDLRDQETGEVYTLGINASSGVWRSLILSLGSCTDFSKPIRFSPYKRGDYDRISVEVDGKRLDWVSDLPPVEEFVLDGQVVRSVQRRESFIAEIVQGIETALEGK